MKARFAYPLLFVLPSLMAAAIAAALAVAGAAGVMWLFVFGDNPWPPVAGWALGSIALVAAVGALGVLLAAAYRFGLRREPQGGVRGLHVLAAVALCIGIPAVVLLHQWQVGNLGPR